MDKEHSLNNPDLGGESLKGREKDALKRSLLPLACYLLDPDANHLVFLQKGFCRMKEYFGESCFHVFGFSFFWIHSIPTIPFSCGSKVNAVVEGKCVAVFFV